MEAGTTVYRAHTSDLSGGFFHYITTGTVAVMPNGLRMVMLHGGDTFYALTPDWHTSRAAAMRVAHTAMVRWIGKQQAAADELAATILAAELAPQPETGVAHGVA